MFFLTFSNTNMLFLEQKFTWMFYIITKALFTTKKVEFINRKKFAKTALNKNSKTFVIHIATLKALLVSQSIYID